MFTIQCNCGSHMEICGTEYSGKLKEDYYIEILTTTNQTIVFMCNDCGNQVDIKQ